VNLMMQVIRGGRLEGSEYLVTEHRAIVEAFETGDSAAAHDAIREEEPRRRYAVVRDDAGYRWERGNTRWSCLTAPGRAPWYFLVNQYGPITVLDENLPPEPAPRCGLSDKTQSIEGDIDAERAPIAVAGDQRLPGAAADVEHAAVGGKGRRVDVPGIGRIPSDRELHQVVAVGHRVSSFQITVQEVYDTLRSTASKRRLSMSRKDKAPAMNRHIPRAVGMATPRNLATEYEAVVSVANFAPTANPPPPIAQVAASRNGKSRISLHPTGPNLACNFTII